jgi:hypothetical protein
MYVLTVTGVTGLGVRRGYGCAVWTGFAAIHFPATAAREARPS